LTFSPVEKTICKTKEEILIEGGFAVSAAHNHRGSEPIMKKCFPQSLLLCQVIFVGCLLLLTNGCQKNRVPEGDPYAMGDAVLVPRLVFQPGDDLEIRFTYAMQFSTSQTVRPDGYIQLPLIQPAEYQVEGKTPEEIRDELMKLYAPELQHPEVVVLTRALYQRRVYVGGAVNEPGTVDMPGRMDVLEAIHMAAGFDEKRASKASVVVIRFKDGKRYGCALDLDEAMKGMEGTPFYLEPYDIVYVPETKIVKVNRWIDQYINKIVPQTGFQYTYSGMKHTTVGMDTNPYNVQ
jgi:protein involved in polysaccharide export with SLBB domain